MLTGPPGKRLSVRGRRQRRLPRRMLRTLAVRQGARTHEGACAGYTCTACIQERGARPQHAAARPTQI